MRPSATPSSKAIAASWTDPAYQSDGLRQFSFLWKVRRSSVRAHCKWLGCVADENQRPIDMVPIIQGNSLVHSHDMGLARPLSQLEEAKQKRTFSQKQSVRLAI